MQDNFPKFEGIATVIIRDVPLWARFFQRFGWFKKAGKIVSVNKYKNVFTTAGKVSILNGLAGSDVSGYFSYLAIGNGVGSPAVGDILLFNETYRNEIGIGNVSGLTLTISTFFPTAAGGGPAAGSYTEIGLFGDDIGSTATPSINTGTLFTHLNITETIGAGQSVTVNYNIVAS